VTDLSEKFLKGNLEAARVIVAKRDKYVPRSLQLAWAEKILKQEEGRKAAVEAERWKKAKEKQDAPKPSFDGPPEAA